MGSVWCEQRLYGAPELVNAYSSLALSASGVALLCNFARKEISILPILAVFFVGLFSFSFHYYPHDVTRLLDEGSLLAYESLVLNVVVKHHNAAAITIISLFCTLVTGRFNCLLLMLQVFTISVYLPSNIRFTSATLVYSSVSLMCWFLDFVVCDAKFFITKWTRLTPHAMWHLVGGLASYYGTVDLFHARNLIDK